MAKNLFKSMTNMEIEKIGREVNYIDTYRYTFTFLGNYYINNDIDIFILTIMKIINEAKETYETKVDSLEYVKELKQKINGLLDSDVLQSINVPLLRKYFPNIPERIIINIYNTLIFLNNLNDQSFIEIINNSLLNVKSFFAERYLINSKKAILAVDLAEYVKAKLYRLNNFQEITLKELELVMFLIQKEFIKNGYTAFNEPIIALRDGPVIESVSKKYHKSNGALKTSHEDIKSYIYIPTYFFEPLNKLLTRVSQMSSEELKEACSYESYPLNCSTISIKRILRKCEKEKNNDC